MADFEKPCFSLELEIFKSTTNDGEPAPAVETPSTNEITFSACYMEFVKNLQSFLQSYNKSLINQACSEQYWENIGPRSFLYGPRCARSVLSRLRADVLPVRPSRLVNKIYVFLVGGKLSFAMQAWETFQYTHFDSCHPPGVRKRFIKGEALRLLRTNSSRRDLTNTSHYSNNLLGLGSAKVVIIS